MAHNSNSNGISAVSQNGYSTVSLTCHLVGLAHHWFTFIYGLLFLDFTHAEDLRVQNMDVHRFRYYTIWNMIIQTVYMFVALVVDVKKIKQLDILKGYLFQALVFPNTLMTFTLFWSFYTYDREMVYPKRADDILPQWMNQNMHTNIIIFVLAEIYIQRFYKPDRKTALVGLLLMNFVYIVQYFELYIRHGVWLYGMNTFDTADTVVMMSVSMLGLILFYFVGDKMTNDKRKHKKIS